MTTRPGREADAFMLRLPNGMRERIKRAADANGRSMNAEIVAVLSERYPEPADPFEVLVRDVLEVLSQGAVENSAADGTTKRSTQSRDALADLLDLLKAEVERRVRG